MSAEEELLKVQKKLQETNDLLIALSKENEQYKQIPNKKLVFLKIKISELPIYDSYNVEKKYKNNQIVAMTQEKYDMLVEEYGERPDGTKNIEEYTEIIEGFVID